MPPTVQPWLGCSNFSHSAIAGLVEERGWRRLSPYDAIGAIPAIAYRLAPQSIVHSWVEVLHDGRWINLEGFILDAGYLDGVRCLFPEARGDFCG